MKNKVRYLRPLALTEASRCLPTCCSGPGPRLFSTRSACLDGALSSDSAFGGKAYPEGHGLELLRPNRRAAPNPAYPWGPG